MQRFTQLKVWERSHAFTLSIYEATKGFPRHELFGITSQLRRAAISIPCNIAEGSKRRHRPDYARFLNTAESSLAEVQALLLLSRDLQYLDGRDGDMLFKESEHIARMTSGLRRAVEATERRECAASPL